jgi:hypothetical protein
VVDAALDHSSHRDRAGGRRIQFQPAKNFRRRWTKLAGTPGRPSRSNGGRVEASPDRSDFAKLGETITASLVTGGIGTRQAVR